jgi:hypothetical protein
VFAFSKSKPTARRKLRTSGSVCDAYFFFFLTAFLAGEAAAFVAALADFLPKTLSQFLENSGLGPERTIGPDIA